MTRKLKILFDFDGTVCKVETIPFVASRLCPGRHKEIESITSLSRSTECGYEENLRRRVAMLGAVSISAFVNEITPDLLRPAIVDFIRKHPDVCEIASCNLDCWCAPLMDSLHITANLSKAIVKGNHAIGVRQMLHKERLVTDYQDLGFRVAFVGDSANDIRAMNKADMAILLNAGENGIIGGLNRKTVIVRSENELIASLENFIKEHKQ